MWLFLNNSTQHHHDYSSKLANIHFAFELQRKLDEHGIPVKSYCVHPGIGTRTQKRTNVVICLFYVWYSGHGVIKKQQSSCQIHLQENYRAVTWNHCRSCCWSGTLELIFRIILTLYSCCTPFYRLTPRTKPASILAIASKSPQALRPTMLLRPKSKLYNII